MVEQTGTILDIPSMKQSYKRGHANHSNWHRQKFQKSMMLPTRIQVVMMNWVFLTTYCTRRMTQTYRPNPLIPAPTNCADPPGNTNPIHDTQIRPISVGGTCSDQILTMAYSTEAHTGISNESDTLNWEPAPRTIQDIMKMPAGTVKDA